MIYALMPIRQHGKIIEIVPVLGNKSYHYVKGKTVWDSGCLEVGIGWSRFRRNENWREINGEFVYTLNS